MKRLLFVLPMLALVTVLFAGCSKDSEYIQCTEEQKSAEGCTLEYFPVCGDNGVTYGNACSACASQNVESYKLGECEAVCDEGAEVCDTPELE
jgi:hypothetical protein